MTGEEPLPAPAADWPHRAASEFVNSGGLRWHVQRMGAGPLILLVHGTGASTHSWAGLAPLLAGFASVLAVDLPGHGYTDLAPGRAMSLPGMAQRVAGLLDDLEVAPALVVGHSAGAAILVRMCLDGTIEPAALVSVNGALLPLPGLSGRVFPGAARVLASLPQLPRLLAQHAAQRVFVDQLIRQTGSSLDRTGLDHYRTLVGSPRHVNGAIQMMANWNLDSLERELPGLQVPLYLVACRNDRAVAFTEATRIKVQMPGAHLQVLPELGHLGHEEEPGVFAELIREIAADHGLVAD
jgi:magnesium chelatase accessory protein